MKDGQKKSMGTTVGPTYYKCEVQEEVIERAEFYNLPGLCISVMSEEIRKEYEQASPQFQPKPKR